jgi:ATP-dependent Clp protease protease subunit
VLYISGEITEELADEVNRALLILSSESRDPITVIINSPGGSTNAGLSIIDMMQLTGCRIRCVCTCLAASMAAVIFSQGDERIMLRHSRLMLHETKVSASFTGGSETLKELTRRLTDTAKILYSLLADRSGRTLKEIEKACSFDNFMSADKAIELGLADKIADSIGMITEVTV